MNSRIPGTVTLILALLASMALAEPPRVVSATPDNGQADVDPATKQIKIAFDQPMSRGGMSIVGGGPSFPKIAGKPRWVNDHTLVIDVQLEPDHDYWLSINSDRFTNFRSAKGEPAVPYPIGFSTGARRGAAPALSPQVNRESIQQLRTAIDENYSYRDLRQVEWDTLFREHTAKLEQAASAKIFARHLAAMLAAAKDMHIVVKVGEDLFPTHRPNAGVNYNLDTLARAVPQWRGNNVVRTGRFDDGIVYILIATWSRSDGLEAAYEALAKAEDARSVIIDVRPNSGGDERLAQQFAGCFIDRPQVYSRNTIRNAGKWLGPFERVVEPNPSRPGYRGRVVVLMGPQNMSSCESFLLMMRQVPGAQLVGARSYGSSGNPKPYELPNGVTVLLPSWQDMLPDGSSLEGVGVAPDLEIKTDPNTLRSRDPVLEAALKLLRENR